MRNIVRAYLAAWALLSENFNEPRLRDRTRELAAAVGLSKSAVDGVLDEVDAAVRTEIVAAGKRLSKRGKGQRVN